MHLDNHPHSYKYTISHTMSIDSMFKTHFSYPNGLRLSAA